MKFQNSFLSIALCVVFGCANYPGHAASAWKIHDMDRPQPKVIAPAAPLSDDSLGNPPSDAIVLFDGKNLDEWVPQKGPNHTWKVKNDYMEVTPKGKAIYSRKKFGDCQLHIEWCIPEGLVERGQNRGNSGVYLMNKYEVQIMDGYHNETYPDGQVGSIYGQNPPLVNACRPAGQWQSYDIIFHRPHFKNGKVIQPAIMTVLHNGVLVQDHFSLWGPTVHQRMASYEGAAHADRLPIQLQEHGNPVRFRNIWIRPLE